MSVSFPSNFARGRTMVDQTDVTELLLLAANGDERAYSDVVDWAYGQLEVLAKARLRKRPRSATLEPAALVNETFVKLLQAKRDFVNRRHLLAFAGTIMLRVLIDYQRERESQKRGGELCRVTLQDFNQADQNEYDLIEFSEVLSELERLDPRKSEVVKLRVLWGYEMTEIAEITAVSLSTIERDWRFARTWLAERLSLSSTRT